MTGSNAFSALQAPCQVLSTGGSTQTQLVNAMITIVDTLRKNKGKSLPLDMRVGTLGGLRRLLFHSNEALRAHSLRTLAQFATDAPYFQELIRYELDHLLCRVLERDKRFDVERLHVVRLLRHWVDLDPASFPRHIVATLVEVADVPEDNFQRVSLTLLRDLAVLNTEVTCMGGGLKLLMDAVLVPANEEVIHDIILALVYIIDDPKKRQFLRHQDNSDDINQLLSPFTDPFMKTAERKPKCTCARKAIVTLMQYWPGLIWFVADNLGLQSLVEALRLPGGPDYADSRQEVLQTIVDIFRISNRRFRHGLDGDSGPAGNGTGTGDDTDTATSASHRRGDSNVPGATGAEGGAAAAVPPPPPPSAVHELSLPPLHVAHNLLTNYTAVLLISFFRAGLIEALVELGRGSDQATSRLCTELLDEFLRLADQYLPSHQCTRLHALPSLIEHAARISRDDRILRARASAMITNLHKVTKSLTSDEHYSPTDYHISRLIAGGAKYRRSRGVDRRQDQIDNLKLKIDLALDESHVEKLIKETKIPSTKNSENWNFDAISELLNGPLKNPSHLAVALKHKFFRRLLSFFRPSRQVFVSMPWTSENTKYVRVACEAIQVLLSTPQGAKFLSEHNFFIELIQILKAELHVNPESVSSRILTPQRLVSTMSREYFTMVGTLTSSRGGLSLMEKVKLFDLLYPLVELKTRDDLVKLLISGLDYNFEGHTRILLQRALTGGSADIRVHSTQHMQLLFRADVNGFSQWGVSFLERQLHDEDASVSRIALNILIEVTTDAEALSSLIKLRPQVLFRRPEAEPILLRFLSQPEGFSYLEEMKWVDTQLDTWHRRGIHDYVQRTEHMIQTAMDLYHAHNGAGEDMGTTTNAEGHIVKKAGGGADLVVDTPLHFYGELCSTDLGCTKLQDAGHFDDFVATVRDENASLTDLRAALWTLGHIGASPTGMSMINQAHMFEHIVHLCEHSPRLSTRGTCLYVLGFLSRTDHGKEKLIKLGWEAVHDSASPIAIPRQVEQLLSIPPYQYTGRYSVVQEGPPPPDFDEDDVRNEILTHIKALSNHISTAGGCKQLTMLRQSSPAEFTDKPARKLLRAVHKLLDTYKFRLPARQFIANLFEEAKLEDSDFMVR